VLDKECWLVRTYLVTHGISMWDCTKIRAKTATASARVVMAGCLRSNNDAHTVKAAAG